MAFFPKKILWKASDGREFLIDTSKENIKTSEELHEHIAALRKKHGYLRPSFIIAVPGSDVNMEETVGKTIDFEDLSEDFKNDVSEALSNIKPDPKKLN